MRTVLLGMLGAFIIGATFVGGYEVGKHHRSDALTVKPLSAKERYELKYGIWGPP